MLCEQRVGDTCKRRPLVSCLACLRSLSWLQYLTWLMGSSICLDHVALFLVTDTVAVAFPFPLQLGKRRRQRIELASRHWQTVSHCRPTKQAGDGSLFLIPAPQKGRSTRQIRLGAALNIRVSQRPWRPPCPVFRVPMVYTIYEGHFDVPISSESRNLLDLDISLTLIIHKEHTQMHGFFRRLSVLLGHIARPSVHGGGGLVLTKPKSARRAANHQICDAADAKVSR